MKAIWGKFKENPLLSILSVLLALTFVAFVCVLLFECAGTYISKLLGLSDKNEVLKFLGIGMGSVLVALLVLMFFSKIKDDPPVSVLIFLIITLGVIFLVVMFSDCPKWIFNRLGIDRTEEPKYEVLKFLGIGMGGILIALQALMSYRRAKAMEETAESQARATEEQAKANQHTEEGQRQERLRNAIEHLGHEKDSVRLGGAYELFHLAKDTLKEDAKEKLSQTVLDILCAHIRQTTGESKYRKAHKSKPSEEIQSLLKLLFVQKHEVFKNCYINLQGSWLNGVNLEEARLENSVLTWARLQKAILCKARLQGANLSLARLQGADLRKAHLQGTNLSLARLQGADLRKAHLQGAILSLARLQGANLHGAQLQGVKLIGADLQGAYCQEKHYPFMSFEKRINKGIGKKLDLSKVIFAGGLNQEDVASLVEGMFDEKANELREILTPHIGKSPSNQPPKNSLALTGSYTTKDAEKWIAEYEKAMSEVPEDDS